MINKLFPEKLKFIVYFFTAKIRYILVLQVIRNLYKRYPTNQMVLIIIQIFDPNAIRKKIRTSIRRTKIAFTVNSGEKLFLQLSDHVDWITFIHGSFDDTYLYLLDDLSKKTKEIWKFIDVGANFGSISIPISQKWEVLAFEPQPELFYRLRVNSQINKNTRITMENVALTSESVVSEKKGTYHLYVPPGNSGAASYISNWNPSLVSSEITTVKVTTLDAAMQNKNKFWDGSNLLIKIDVEGSELEVLQGGLTFITKTRPIIVLEHRIDLLKTKEKELLSMIESLPDYCRKSILTIEKNRKIYLGNWESSRGIYELALIPNEKLNYFSV
jgi:FkbM family methyltransferase